MLQHFLLDSGGVQYESIEALLDLETSAPYTADCSCSKEAPVLRKIAIETPESLQDPNFVFKHFITLRIVDKNVIDKTLFCIINVFLQNAACALRHPAKNTLLNALQRYIGDFN